MTLLQSIMSGTHWKHLNNSLLYIVTITSRYSSKETHNLTINVSLCLTMTVLDYLYFIYMISYLLK